MDGSAIGLYQDKPSPTASVECEPEIEQEFDRELFIEAVRVHACIGMSTQVHTRIEALNKMLFYSQAGKWVWLHHVAL